MNELNVITVCLMLVSCFVYFSILKMEASYSSKRSVNFQQNTLRYVPEDRTLLIIFTPVLGSIQALIQWSPAILSLRVKRTGRVADHSPPTSAEVKNNWIYISTPLYVFMS
jgi:hypothetical protein